MPPEASRVEPPAPTAWDRYWSEWRRPAAVIPGRFTVWSVPFLRAGSVRTVVDLGCGAGRDLAFLLQEGFRVTGVDASRVAVTLAEQARTALPPKVARRGSVVRADALQFLTDTPPRSVDAVHAPATYQGFSPAALDALFDQLRRVLVPGGVHVWSIRNDRHGDRHRPESVAPNRPGGPVSEIRFFSRRLVDRLTGDGFERLAIEEGVVPPHARSYYVADRRIAGPSRRPVGIAASTLASQRSSARRGSDRRAERGYAGALEPMARPLGRAADELQPRPGAPVLRDARHRGGGRRP